MAETWQVPAVWAPLTDAFKILVTNWCFFCWQLAVLLSPETVNNATLSVWETRASPFYVFVFQKFCWWYNMSDYSAVAPPPQQNFNQSSAFAAALQRAKQVSWQNNQHPVSRFPFMTRYHVPRFYFKYVLYTTSYLCHDCIMCNR